jgi:hypothetical protein
MDDLEEAAQIVPHSVPNTIASTTLYINTLIGVILFLARNAIVYKKEWVKLAEELKEVGEDISGFNDQIQKSSVRFGKTKLMVYSDALDKLKVGRSVPFIIIRRSWFSRSHRWSSKMENAVSNNMSRRTMTSRPFPCQNSRTNSLS